LAEKYHLSLVVLFGSQAKGKTHSQSDVDLAFSAEEPMSPADLAKMQTDFSENLKIKDLEMVGLNNAHPFLMKQVAQNSIVLYEKERSLFAEFKIYAFKRFVEAKNLLDLRKLSLNRFLQKI
ncbi:MAG: nucleotidyltransferase domain-containing protein, partial [Candidatus Parcubacteria bacterium]|nr:nucleotidyltransferase domain-containing protein [Candidatus Parcubacteria bacterium]